jgi:hypothetical protein
VKRALLLGLILLLAGSAFALQEAPVYPNAYWVLGTLSKGAAPDVAGYKVVLYKQSSDPAPAYAKLITAADGSYYLNPYDDQRFADAPAFQPGRACYIGVVAKTAADGKSYGVNQKTIYPQTNDPGYFAIDLTLKEGEGIPDPDGGGNGPIINLKLFLEAYYSSATHSSKPFTVLVEARTGSSPDSAVQANTVGTCLATLDASGLVTNNGFWTIVPPDDDYYLVIKHQIPGIKAGPNHLAVITMDKQQLSLAKPLDLDLTVVNNIYKKPDGGINQYLAPLKPLDGKNVLWLGDYNADRIVNELDSGLWWNNFQRFRSATPPPKENSAEPYEQADYNRDGTVNEIDSGLWWNNFQDARAKTTPNSYVP